MKKIFFYIFLVLGISNIYAQVDLVAGMGISFVATPSLNDYLNYNFPRSEELRTFNSMVEFYGEADYTISPKFQIGFEYVYSLYGYSSTLATLNYQLDYNHQKPSLLAYYVIAGEGYKFKFGGGLGIRMISLTEKKIITEEYSSTGFGVLARIQGHTKLGGSFYANIGGTARFDAPGEPENGTNKIHDPITNSYVNINSFSVSVDIGISYFL